MNRKEAEALLGQPVYAWTSMNGEYAGLLREVRGSPWRGRVEITGVLKPAAFEFGRLHQRKGMRIGDQIEVGGSSIRRGVLPGTSYLEALRARVVELRSMLERAGRKDDYHLVKAIEWTDQRILEEERSQTPSESA